MEKWPRRARTAFVYFVYSAVAALVAFSAIWLALLLAPTQKIIAAGQPVAVGAAAPTLGLFGSGQIDIFGQSLPTVAQFFGPMRPLLRLNESHVALNQQLNQALSGGSNVVKSLGAQFQTAWVHYFTTETVIAALIGLGVAAALAKAYSTIRRRDYGRWQWVLIFCIGPILTAGVNLGCVAVLANSMPGVLAHVHSLDDLVGSSPLADLPAPVGPKQPHVQVVVLGDSTAAAIGNVPVSNPTATDKACSRSRDSYAADLADSNGWDVLSLACANATIPDGLLGIQWVHGEPVPTQFGVLESAIAAKAVIVSVGANDMAWSAMVAGCAAMSKCDDRVSTALFQSNLGTFAGNYDNLLTRLSQLPKHPKVVINLYYLPFGSDTSCLSVHGGSITSTKAQLLTGRLEDVNAVLATGARQFGFTTADPDFNGHQLCAAQPYVQGMHDPNPFHPTAAGELAIALADQMVLGNTVH